MQFFLVGNKNISNRHAKHINILIKHFKKANLTQLPAFDNAHAAHENAMAKRKGKMTNFFPVYRVTAPAGTRVENGQFIFPENTERTVNLDAVSLREKNGVSEWLDVSAKNQTITYAAPEIAVAQEANELEEIILGEDNMINGIENNASEVKPEGESSEAENSSENEEVVYVNVPELIAQNNILEQQVNALSPMKLQLEADVKTLNREKAELTSAVQTAQNATEEQKQKVAQLQKNVAALEEELRQAKEALATKTQHVDTLAGDLENLKTNFTATETRLNTEMADLKGKLTQENKALKADLETHIKQNATLVSQLGETKKVAEKRNERNEAEMAILQAQLHEKAVENDKLARDLGAMQASAKSYWNKDNEISQLKAQVTAHEAHDKAVEALQGNSEAAKALFDKYENEYQANVKKHEQRKGRISGLFGTGAMLIVGLSASYLAGLAVIPALLSGLLADLLVTTAVSWYIGKAQERAAPASIELFNTRNHFSHIHQTATHADVEKALTTCDSTLRDLGSKRPPVSETENEMVRDAALGLRSARTAKNNLDVCLLLQFATEKVKAAAAKAADEKAAAEAKKAPAKAVAK